MSTSRVRVIKSIPASRAFDRLSRVVPVKVDGREDYIPTRLTAQAPSQLDAKSKYSAYANGELSTSAVDGADKLQGKNVPGRVFVECGSLAPEDFGLTDAEQHSADVDHAAALNGKAG